MRFKFFDGVLFWENITIVCTYMKYPFELKKNVKSSQVDVFNNIDGSNHTISGKFIHTG